MKMKKKKKNYKKMHICQSNGSYEYGSRQKKTKTTTKDLVSQDEYDDTLDKIQLDFGRSREGEKKDFS